MFQIKTKGYEKNKEYEIWYIVKDAKKKNLNKIFHHFRSA